MSALPSPLRAPLARVALLGLAMLLLTAGPAMAQYTAGGDSDVVVGQ
jgi:hypothetical protein